jgi:hypothetical protein
MADRTVDSDTTYSSLSASSPGNRTPGANSPDLILAARWAAICS